ncbi:DUF5348 domain-containing protein [Sporolactobacillus vineae]|uniref:DUF5348 domain-containing protein n=2 Tax=Sporolactobacillus vineae TaxID=444463 RepID=UPI000287F6F7
MNSPHEMFYDRELDRWVVLFEDQSRELDCGEIFDLILGYYYLNCTLEFGNCWYIITEGVRFNLNDKQRYQIIL